MIDLGIVKPGKTIRIPFASFAGSTGASAATTGTAVTDIVVYKDGSTTERASTSGYTFTVDFDAKTGLNLITIDLADNSTAGFFAAGSEYHVGIADVTIDSQTVRTWLARFEIGIPDAVLNTTIATLSSQVSFTLTAGPAENDALNGCVVYLHDVASAVQGAYGVVVDYVGSTKTVTLAAAPTFTIAATDNISFFPPSNVWWVTSNLSTFGDFAEMASFAEAAATHANDLLNTTRTEPTQGKPGATLTLPAKIDYLYKAWRNKKTQTATAFNIFNDDAATVDHKTSISDDGTTTTVGELETGP